MALCCLYSYTDYSWNILAYMKQLQLCESIFFFYTFQRENDIDSDQTAGMLRLVWSELLMFAHNKIRFSCNEAHTCIKYKIPSNFVKTLKFLTQA